MPPLRLPTPPLPAPQPSAFVLLSPACLPGVSPHALAYQHALYVWAFRQAQEVARPSLLERDLLGVWN